MEKITGFRTSVLFHSEETGYAVIRIKIDDGQEEKLTLVGYFPIPEPYELFRYYGNLVEHNRFGKQFEVTSFEKINPRDKEAVIRFLSSSKFPGVGKKIAELVYDTLGVDALDTIQNEPSVLETIEGLKQSHIDSITKGICSNGTNLEQAVKLFVQHGLSLKDILKLESIYKENMINVVLNDPYRVIKDIDINFKIIDKIAISMGFQEDDVRRISAAILFATTNACNRTGNTFTDKNTIYRYTHRLINNLDSELFKSCFETLESTNQIIVNESRVHPVALFNSEVGIAEYLTPFIYREFSDISESLIELEIARIEQEIGINYSPDQCSAIKSVFKKGMNIITGGPGVGKTTIINAIIKVYQNVFRDKSINLCAPTGRAAKRLTDVTGCKASTIHRLLGWDLHSNKFAFNEYNPLNGNFIIIDEFSMVDTELFHSLLKAINSYDRILIVGDDEQLPSVMPGDNLADLVNINRINRYNLSQIFRQQENSSIISLAYEIRAKEVRKEDFKNDEARFHELNSTNSKQEIINLVNSYRELGYTDSDIQVIAPMYLGICGIDNLNEAIRNIFNPKLEQKELIVGSRLFREGDKVLQLKNEPDKDVYNGDIGFIIEILHKGENGQKKNQIIADFDGNIVEYDHNNFNHLTHAYCISVHKSQGSEYPIVIMPILFEHQIMLKRKLIYTGITRAKKFLELVGEFSALEQGVMHSAEKKRETTVVERLIGKLI